MWSYIFHCSAGFLFLKITLGIVRYIRMPSLTEDCRPMSMNDWSLTCAGFQGRSHVSATMSNSPTLTKTCIYGMPQPTFHFEYSKQDEERAHAMMQDLLHTAGALGGFLPGVEPAFQPPGGAFHLTVSYVQLGNMLAISAMRTMTYVLVEYCTALKTCDHSSHYIMIRSISRIYTRLLGNCTSFDLYGCHTKPPLPH